MHLSKDRVLLDGGPWVLDREDQVGHSLPLSNETVAIVLEPLQRKELLGVLNVGPQGCIGDA